MLMQLADFATSGCDTFATLDCLSASSTPLTLRPFRGTSTLSLLVRIPFSHSMPVDRNYATAEFGANVYRPADLNLFFNSFRPDQVNNTPTLISVEGGVFLLSVSFGHTLASDSSSLTLRIFFPVSPPHILYPV
jgi:tripeptidyl-peptidase-1